MARAKRGLDGSELARELGSAVLGDSRRSERLAHIVGRVAEHPDASFPASSRSDAELEAVYRFFGNESVTPEAILEPHLLASVARAGTHGDVLVAHDTTHFTFEGEREGLGRIHQMDQGFWGHFALAMSSEREVFGVVGLRYGTRIGPTKWRGSRRIAGGEEPSETQRWPDLVAASAERLGSGRAIHLMDREADWFELFKFMRERGERFVVRLTHDRLLESGGRVSSLLSKAETKATREVELSARAEGHNAKERARHPGRKPRVAELHVSAVSASLRSAMSNGVLELNVVRVVEATPPEGCAPVVWNLVTTEPVETAEDVLRVVDAYRARWVIEEYFKAIKTGCAFEKRQLASYRALLNALAVFVPIAWSLLRLRDIGRRHGARRARDVLEPRLLAVLVQLARRPMPTNPNARDVMYAVAGLAGHLTRNGDPGWITLGLGYERLLEAVRLAALLAET